MESYQIKNDDVAKNATRMLCNILYDKRVLKFSENINNKNILER